MVDQQGQLRGLGRHLRVGGQKTQDALLPVLIALRAQSVLLDDAIEVPLQIQIGDQPASHGNQPVAVSGCPLLRLGLQVVGP